MKYLFLITSFVIMSIVINFVFLKGYYQKIQDYLNDCINIQTYKAIVLNRDNLDNNYGYSVKMLDTKKIHRLHSSLKYEEGSIVDVFFKDNGNIRMYNIYSIGLEVILTYNIIFIIVFISISYVLLNHKKEILQKLNNVFNR